MDIFTAVAMYIAVRIFSTDKVLTAKFSFKRIKKENLRSSLHLHLTTLIYPSITLASFIPSKNKILFISFCGYFSLTNWLNME